VRLPKPLRNGIFRAVEAGGLDASECTFYYGDEQSRFSHLPSGSYFFVTGSPADSTATTVVGDHPPDTSVPFTWVILDQRVREWAEEVKRDVDTPDLSQGLDPFERVIRRARDVLATSEFASAYPGAFDAWAAAERLLWEGDSGSKLTTIGHNVREAMQAFATAMVDAYEPPGVDPNVANVERRLGAVIALHRPKLGDAHREALEALGTLWTKVSRLVQRQEHGAQREGEPVTWSDARRIVYLTMFCMAEFVDTFADLQPPAASLEGGH
jgi:hypothetical protein